MASPRRAGSPRAARTRSTLAEGSPRARFSRTWMPGAKRGGPGRAAARAGEVDEPQRGPVARPAASSRCSPRAGTSATRASTAAAAVAWRARARGRSPRERLDGSLASPRGWLVRPAQTPCSLTASQVPPDCSSRPPRMRGPDGARTVTGVAGRSISSSRLAPTMSGSSGTTREAMTRRHTRTTLPRSQLHCNWGGRGLPSAPCGLAH